MISSLPVPLSDEDSFDVVDAAISELAGRRGLWIGDDVVLIHLLASLIAQAERCLPEAVASALVNGYGWDDVAQLLGTSSDEVRLRFDPQSPGRGREMAAGGWWLTSPLGGAGPRDCAGPSLHRPGCCASLARRPAAALDRGASTAPGRAGRAGRGPALGVRGAQHRCHRSGASGGGLVRCRRWWRPGRGRGRGL